MEASGRAVTPSGSLGRLLCPHHTLLPPPPPSLPPWLPSCLRVQDAAGCGDQRSTRGVRKPWALIQARHLQAW